MNAELKARAWPSGTSEMAERIHMHNWAATPLGPIEAWPQSLKTVVDLLLPSGFPMIALWGAQLIQIYNDGYRNLMGLKHPAGLGQPTRDCWPEVRHITQPIYERVWAGETLTFEDALYPITRSGTLEDAWFTLSYSPLRDETGAIAGVLVTVFETTARYLVEAALRESQQQLSMALDAARMGTFDWDPVSHRIALTNHSAELFGLIADELLLTCEEAFKIIHPDDMEQHRARFLEASHKGEDYLSEYRVARPRDGRIVWIEERGSSVVDPRTGARRVKGVHLDISERKHADEMLRRQSAQVATLLDQAPLGVYLVDADFRIQHVNPTARPVFGDIENLIGRDFDDVIHRLWLKDYADEVSGIFRHTLETGEPHVEPERIKQRRDTGATEIYEWRVDRIPLPDGRHGVVCYFRDISEQVLARRAIAENEERFRQFGDASFDVLWIRNAKTLDMEYLNRAFGRVYGEDREQVLGEGVGEWSRLIHSDDRAGALAAVERVRKGEQVTHEFRIMRADGEMRWIENTDFPLFDADGQVQRIAGFAKDVTEAKQTRERLKVLVAELQHRTRNLIGVVRSMADRTLASSRSLGEFQERFWDRLGALARVNGLLSRLNEGDRITFDELLLTELAGHGVVDGDGYEGQRCDWTAPPVCLCARPPCRPSRSGCMSWRPMR